MNIEKKLSTLSEGMSGRVVKLTNEYNMRRRLQDLGLIEGALIECVGKSPSGDPSAYLIRGAVFALRSEDAGKIIVSCPFCAL